MLDRKAENFMQSTMQDYPLTITAIFRHGARVYPNSEILTWTGNRAMRRTFAETAARTRQLAAALLRLGVGKAERVGTFCWNSQEHIEAYFAVPAMGAVLHTLNIRLFPDQLAYVINHAEDRTIVIDVTLAPLLARVAEKLKTVKQFIVTGDLNVNPACREALEALRSGGSDVLNYDELIEREEPDFDWPELDERAAAAMCYTSGTTGNPKGVVYSHRSTYLHSMAICMSGTFGFTERDRVLMIVPMFHVNAWGMPYAAWLAGADPLLPGKFLQAEPLARFITEERATIAAGVPTIWSELLRYSEAHPEEVDFSSLRLAISGGAPLPRALNERFHQRHGIYLLQSWGMTETSPLGLTARPPRSATPENEMDYRMKTGRIVHGVELRITDDGGRELPWDGKSVGEIEVRGPWITGSYFGEDAPEKFRDGWLRTGDVGHVDGLGFVQITDRSKDVIKSGGEWISSVELENAIMAHPHVREAAVVGVPDKRWDERPLACVVTEDGKDVSPEDLCSFLEGRVSRWWIPERWAFVKEIPKTSVGKFDKKVLRAQREAGELEIITTRET
jgi:fatty-acyl-CoA synthase